MTNEEREDEWFETFFDNLSPWIQIPIAIVSAIFSIMILGMGLYTMIMAG